MKLGISLAGGGVKGAAHIGALKAFEEEKIKFDYISGTSSGSIVAALYAIGYTPDEIYELFKKYCNQIKYVDACNIFRLIGGLILKRKITIDGLNNGNKIEKIINKACKNKNITNINEIKNFLLIPSVDVNNGKIYLFCSKEERNTYSNDMVYINDVDIGKAVRASCSYPGVFSPCEYDNKKLIDGGIRENVPWKVTKACGADKVISIVFEKDIENDEEKDNIIDVVSKALAIQSFELSEYELAGADYLIKIKTKDIKLLEVNKIDFLYELGYKVTKEKIKELKRETKFLV